MQRLVIMLFLGLVLLQSCKKDVETIDNKEPVEVIDSSTIHVVGQTIDSGFVFGRWTLCCYYAAWTIDTPPYESGSETNCNNHPIYEFKPNGLMYIYTYNGRGDTTLKDSLIYWYNLELKTYRYQIALDSTGANYYKLLYSEPNQYVSYRNDSMFLTQYDMATVTRSFVRKD